MNRTTFTDTELRQAALQVHEAMMAALTPVAEHDFSFDFHRKMATLRHKILCLSHFKTYLHKEGDHGC